MTAALVAAGERHVRTPEGAALYDQPIGAVITKDIIEAAKRAARAVTPGEAATTQAARQVQPSSRDSIRQRIRNWFSTPDMTPESKKIVDGFDPRTFQSDQQAGQYALGEASPGRFEVGGSRTTTKRAAHWSSQDQVSIASDSLGGFREAQADLRAGKPDSPEAKAFVAKFNRNSKPTTDDLLVSRRVGLDAFPGGGVEGLAGKEIHDPAFFQGNLGTPIGSAPVLLTVATPKGTRAMFTGNGPNDRGVILDRGQHLQVTKVTPDGKGGWYVAAVATPSGQGKKSEVLKEGDTTSGTRVAERGGPGAPPLLEAGPERRPGFAQARRFDQPETHAVPSPEPPGKRVPSPEISDQPGAIRQTKQLPSDTVAELNDPKTTISRYRDIAREADIKVPARIIKKADIRDFLLGKKGAPPARARGLRVDTPEVETRKLSAEAVGQLNDPKTTVAQLRKIAKDHGIKVPSTATRKADIRAHLMQAGGVKENPPDMLPEGERSRFRAGWREVSKAPEGLAQAELNEIFLDVHGGQLGVLDAARRLENSAGIDREERDRLRARRGDGEPGAEERKLDDEIAAKEKAAKFLRDYRLAEEVPAPAPVKKAVKKAAPRKATPRLPSAAEVEEASADYQIGIAYQAILDRQGRQRGDRVSSAELREELAKRMTRSEVDTAMRRVGTNGYSRPNEVSPLVAKKAAPKKATGSAGTPRAVPKLSREELEKFNEGQLRVMARNGDVDIPEGATRAEIIDALISRPTVASRQRARPLYLDAENSLLLDEYAKNLGLNISRLMDPARIQMRTMGEPLEEQRPFGYPFEQITDGLKSGQVSQENAVRELRAIPARVKKDLEQAREHIARMGRDRALPYYLAVERDAPLATEAATKLADALETLKLPRRKRQPTLGTLEAGEIADIDEARFTVPESGSGFFDRPSPKGGLVLHRGQIVPESFEHPRSGMMLNSDENPPIRPGLTPEENRALDLYVSSAIADPLNAALRGNTEPPTVDVTTLGERQPVDLHDIQRRLDEAIAASELSRDTTLWRGTLLRPLDSRKLQPGTIISEPGYLSTAVDERLARNIIGWRKRNAPAHRKPVLFKILAEKGTHAAVGHEAAGEVLLGRGARIQILRTEDEKWSGATLVTALLINGPESRQSSIVMEEDSSPRPDASVLEAAPGEEDLFPQFSEEQLRDIAQARGIEVPASATKAEIGQMLTSGRTNPMTGPATVADIAPPQSAAAVRQVLADAIGHRGLARATQDEFRRLTGRELVVDFAPDADLNTSKEHMEGVLRATEAWPDTDLREVRWFHGDIGGPWAIGGNNAIIFNTSYTSKKGRQRYLAELAAGVAGWDGGTGFHPRGADNPSAAAMHEFGHVVDPGGRRLELQVRQLVQRRAKEARVHPTKLIRQEVSDYATTDPYELVAEAFLDVLLNNLAAGQLSREIVELLRRAIGL